MLQQLVINDLAVIDALNIEFKPGMTVLTGETGAGKSILLDALGLILGDRADTSFIRGGTDKTDITAIFSIEENSDVQQKLDELDVEATGELFIRRTISRDGRSRAYLNNTPVPIQTIREIGEYLVDIHGQHAHQSLSRPNTQRLLLDQFGQYDELLNDVNQTYLEWKQIDTQLNDMNHAGSDYESRLALLKYQVEELLEINLVENEYEALSEEYKRLSNSQKILSLCQKSLDDLSMSDNAIDNRLSSYHRDLMEVSELDKRLENITSLLDGAIIQLDEAANELRHYIEGFDVDGNQLATIEKRLDKLHELARKHNIKPEQLSEHLDLLTKELETLEGGQEQQAALEKKRSELTVQFFEKAKELSHKRKQAATTIVSGVTEKMHELGIGGRFEIEIESIDDDNPHKHGTDKISFLVSTNAGQPLRPITKVASGGELSRLSLAIQIIGSKDSGIPTMIFDEVDTGISGGIAEIVGVLLNKLAQQRQVLCVTHLAQVASCGHHHLLVSKSSEDNETFTNVSTLNKQQRIDEIARMLAGITITDESRANAAQMLESTETF